MGCYLHLILYMITIAWGQERYSCKNVLYYMRINSFQLEVHFDKLLVYTEITAKTIKKSHNEILLKFNRGIKMIY